MKTLYFIIGTQAELMKLFQVINKARDRGYQCEIISTGQNNLKESPFLALSNSNIDIDISANKGEGKNTSNYLIWFLKTALYGKKKLNEYFDKNKRENSIVIVHGDTLTTTIGAWICKKIKMPYVHIESGLRSYNFLSPFPEEFDRLYGSLHSKMNFCPGKIHADYAEKRFKGIAVDTVYNTGIETLYYALNKNKNIRHEKQPNNKYFMFMLHRQENIMNKKFVLKVVEQIINMADKMECVFIYHEQTKSKMEQFGVFEKFKNHPNITILPRQDYCDFIKLVNYAEFIATDGCGNQQEFYYMGKPYLILRSSVEKNTEGLDWNAKVFNNDFKSISYFLNEYVAFVKPKVEPKVLPSEIVVSNLSQMFEN